MAILFSSVRAISSTKRRRWSSRPSRQSSKTAAFLSDFRDLAVGDYVVHVEHGIGQYRGLKEIAQADGSTAEFMRLEYAETARLYVPLTRLDLVQKYRSPEAWRPYCRAWERSSGPRPRPGEEGHAGHGRRAAEALRRAQTAEGFAVFAGSNWQREFEDAFEYTETKDQNSAIAESSATWKRPIPWIACSAATSATAKPKSRCARLSRPSMDGKQVAVLAPTTVLAFQHFETFKRRFAAFPVRIECSRASARRRNRRRCLRTGGNGKVDIVIGTHRLLSKDVKFPDLGLWSSTKSSVSASATRNG